MGTDSFLGIMDKVSIIEYAKSLTDNSIIRSMCSISILDIDNFKAVNDTYGHAYGDEVLIGICNIIKESITGVAEVGRFGGDEFMIVCDQMCDYQGMRDILSRIRVGVETAYAEQKITVSIGSAVCDDYASTYNDMFNLADKMLYRAKEKGKNRYIIFRPEVHGDVLNHSMVDFMAMSDALKEDKESVVLRQMDKCLGWEPVLLDVLCQEVAATFDLDEVSIINQASDNVLICYEKVHDVVPKSASFMNNLEIQASFTPNRLFVATIPTGMGEEVQAYYDAHHITEFMAYKLYINTEEYYVYFIKKDPNARKWEKSDTLMLNIIGKMYEKVLERR